MGKVHGKLLHEVMGWDGPVTLRQYMVWQAWRALQWNKPSLTDHYLMQVACETARPNRKDGNSLQPDKFRIRFKVGPAAPRTPVSTAQAAEISKSVWAARIGAVLPEAREGEQVQAELLTTVRPAQYVRAAPSPAQSPAHSPSPSAQGPRNLPGGNVPTPAAAAYSAPTRTIRPAVSTEWPPEHPLFTIGVPQGQAFEQDRLRSEYERAQREQFMPDTPATPPDSEQRDSSQAGSEQGDAEQPTQRHE